MECSTLTISTAVFAYGDLMWPQIENNDINMFTLSAGLATLRGLDTTNFPIGRLCIQYGTSFCYPVYTMGVHVPAVPNGCTGRVTPMKTRGVVAMSGTFGYEMDLSKCTQEEKEITRQQAAQFKEYYDLIRDGDYYRLTGPFHGASPFLALRVKGLDPSVSYGVNGGGSWPGDVLMYAG